MIGFAFETATSSWKFSWRVYFALGVEHNCDVTSVLFNHRAVCTSTTPFIGARVQMTHLLQVRGW